MNTKGECHPLCYTSPSMVRFFFLSFLSLGQFYRIFLHLHFVSVSVSMVIQVKHSAEYYTGDCVFPSWGMILNLEQLTVQLLQGGIIEIN